MSLVTQYEKVDSNNIRKRIKETVLTNKQDLQDRKTNFLWVVNMSDNQMESLAECYEVFKTPDAVRATAQQKADEIDALLNLFNNTTTQENIDFIDE